MGAVTEERRESLTVREVMSKLGVSRATGYRLIDRGEFPGAFKVGTAVRIPREDVDEFVRKNRVADDE